MLLTFETENYKSFKDRVIFSMEPAPKQKGLDYSVFKEAVNKKEYKGLSVAVIYGPNAAGKTNLLGAIDTFKNIVLKGNIRNSQTTTPNIASCSLELIPNNIETKKSTFFSLKFIQNDLLIKYSLSIDLGSFLDIKYDRSILNEILEVNEKVIFKRSKNELVFDNLKVIEDFLISNFKKNSKLTQAIALNSLNKEELFLMNGFKTIVSSKFVEFITHYFNYNLNIYFQSERTNVVPVFPTKTVTDKYLNKAANAFGVTSNKLVYLKKDDTKPPVLCSVINKIAIPAELFESYGTVRFTNIYPMLLNALETGSTLIIDEFDTSIHPMAIMNIISNFHNNEINTKHAQLIFNTYNPLYLNNNILRRDEIKFVDRDNTTNYSKHYSLSDFGTKGTNARKGKDYMNNYFMNEYGAIKDVDFTDVFEELMKEKKD